jgi:hypothetical protein
MKWNITADRVLYQPDSSGNGPKNTVKTAKSQDACQIRFESSFQMDPMSAQKDVQQGIESHNGGDDEQDNGVPPTALELLDSHKPSSCVAVGQVVRDDDPMPPS